MKQTDRVPHMARGAAESAGVPAERAGVPAESAGVPAESAGTTKTSYPLMKYLSLLLAVALLFSGVTFARYLSNDQIDASVGIAAFDATYSIDRVNSTTFGNQDYWIETGNSGYVPQGENTAITVGITLKNNGDTDVHPTLHLEGPADYWDNIALQFSTSRNIAVETVLTPQFVIADLVKERKVIEEGDANYGKEHYIEYGDYKTWDNEPWLTGEPSEDTDEGSEGSGETSENEIGYSDDFDPLGDVTAQLTMNGGLTKDDDGTVGGSVTATWGGTNNNENTLTISASKAERDYAVGFVRESNAGVLSPIFVNCEREMTVYSIDLDLGALSLAAKQGNTASEQPLVLWLTWTDAAPNNSKEADEQFWTDLAKGTRFSITSNGNKIDITGYHFDVSGVPVVDEIGNETDETTTVRIKKTLGSDTLDYFHVASINDNDGAYTHKFGERKEVTVDGATKTIAQCLNQDEGARMYVDLTKFVSKDYNVTDAISVSTIRWEEDSEQSFQYAPIQQRAFGVSFRATFVQSSEAP